MHFGNICYTGVSGLHHIRLKSLLTEMADIDLNNTKIAVFLIFSYYVYRSEFVSFLIQKKY